MLVGTRLYFHVQAGSRSRAHLVSQPRCTCLFLDPRGCYYVKGTSEFAAELEGRAVYRMRVRDVLEDVVPDAEAKARLLAGLDFEISPQGLEALMLLRDKIAGRVSERSALS